MPDILTDDEIARVYLEQGGLVVPSALTRWLEHRGLGHRSAASIAEAVNRLQVERPQPIESAEDFAFRDDVRQGTTATDADLAARVAAMSLAEFANFRAQAGMQRGVLDHLAGTA